MEQRALQSLAATVAEEAAARWQATGAPRLIRAVENAVYEIQVGGDRRILRLTHAAHRSVGQLDAELRWIDRLAAAGVDVARPLPSARGALLERVGDGSFAAASFAWAAGEPLNPDSPRWHAGTIAAWGRTLARLHRLAPAHDELALARPPWEDEVIRYRQHLQDEERVEFDEVAAWSRSLPTDAGRFGLVHADPWHGNLHAHDRGVTLFDFDDCCRHWHLYDLAVALHVVLLPHRDHRACADAGRAFLAPLVAGYREERPLGRDDLALLPRFLRLRDLLLLGWCRAKWPLEPNRPYVLTIAANVADAARYGSLPSAW